MANIFDYMIWRDIDIKNVEINEIDALILSRLSYFPLDNLNLENETITLKKLITDIVIQKIKEEYYKKKIQNFSQF